MTFANFTFCNHKSDTVCHTGFGALKYLYLSSPGDLTRCPCRFRYTFELCLSSEKLYQFGLETPDALHSWAKAIGKVGARRPPVCITARDRSVTFGYPCLDSVHHNVVVKVKCKEQRNWGQDRLVTMGATCVYLISGFDPPCPQPAVINPRPAPELPVHVSTLMSLWTTLACWN